MSAWIDLNADLGEECGDDEVMLALVTSASVAAGGHAGGGAVLARTVVAARAAQVAVGAHPSYPDRPGFGRVSRAAELDVVGLRRLVAEQVATVVDACAAAGVAMTHVKAHGALYGDVAGSRELAEAFLEGVAVAAGDVAILGPAGTRLAQACGERGVRLIAEGFADRVYAADGTLVPRSHAGAVHEDPLCVAAQAVALATGQPIETADGSRIVVPVESLCIHGDSAGAVALASATRSALLAADVTVRSPWA